MTAIGTALAIAMAVAAPVRGEMVCRFTGQAMKPCPCPAGLEDAARMATRGCCEFRGSKRSDVPAVVSKARIDGPPYERTLAMPAVTGWSSPLLASVAERPRALDPPPPEARRFIRLQQLLI